MNCWHASTCSDLIAPLFLWQNEKCEGHRVAGLRSDRRTRHRFKAFCHYLHSPCRPFIARLKRAPISRYAIAVTAADHKPGIVKLLRQWSADSIGELMRKVGTQTPVVLFDTTDFALEVPSEQGTVTQQQTLLAIIDALEQAGASLRITHHAGTLVEPLTREMLENLFESELLYLGQEHD